MLSVGVLGLNFKTANLSLREAVARRAEQLIGERALFFPHPIVVLSTCNRTEIYFSADDLGRAHSDLLAYLRFPIAEPFEHRLYSYFGIDCFAHICRVAAGLDSAIFAETEIQRQVKVAYSQAQALPSSLHYLFQKALKVSKLVRVSLDSEKRFPSLYGTLWRLAPWKEKRILLVGNSEINRGLISYLTHKGIGQIALCTRDPDLVTLKKVELYDRSILHHWQDFGIVVCATHSERYLIQGNGTKEHIVFDLSVPRNVDPQLGAKLYNIDQLIQSNPSQERGEDCEALIWENVNRLARIYSLRRSKFSVPWEAGEGNDIANVFHSCYK